MKINSFIAGLRQIRAHYRIARGYTSRWQALRVAVKFTFSFWAHP